MLLFDNLTVIYVFKYVPETLHLCFFFVIDFPVAQSDFKYLCFIFSCTCPMTMRIDCANKDVFSAGLGESILLPSPASLETKLPFQGPFGLAI